MRLSELTTAFSDLYGPVRGAALQADLGLPSLGHRTAAEAARDGEDPQVIWDAVCDEMSLPEALRFPHRMPTRRST